MEDIKTKKENKTKESSERTKIFNSRDTLVYNTLMELIKLYDKKTDSLQKLINARYNTIKNKPIGSEDSVHLIEAMYYALFEKRNAHIYQYLITHEKNMENMNGVLYLVVDKKFPIMLIDSLYNQFPVNLRNASSGKLIFSKI